MDQTGDSRSRLACAFQQGLQAFYHRLPTPAIVTFPIVARLSGPDKESPGAKRLFTFRCASAGLLRQGR